MTFFLLSERDARDAHERRRQRVVSGGVMGGRPKEAGAGGGGLFLVRSPATGIPSGQSELCDVLDASEADTGNDLEVYNPFSGAIGASAKLVVGPWVGNQPKHLPTSEDCVS